MRWLTLSAGVRRKKMALSFDGREIPARLFEKIAGDEND